MNKLLILLTLLSTPCLAATKAEHAARARTEIQLLWNSTGALTREYLIAKTLDLPNEKRTAKLLTKNTEAIGTLIEPLYGKDITKKLTKLLKEQAEITIDLIDAIKKKDDKDRQKALNEWKKNACELSTFLDKTNPYIAYDKLYEQFLTYLTKLTTMITHRVEKKWDDDLEDYEAVRTQLHTIVSGIGKALTDAFPQPKEKVPPPKPKVTVPLPPGTSIRKTI